MSSVNLSSKNITDSENIFSSFIEPSKILSLDLSNNKITKLPTNLSYLTNLKYLSLLNNPLEDYQSIGKSLSTLPKLVELKLDLTTQENAYLILSQLPNLLFLNGKSTSDDEDDNKNQIDLNDTETDKSSLKSEIPNFNSVTNRITQILIQRKEKTEDFYTEFQGILEKQINLMNNLDNKLPNYVYATYVQQAKVEIYSYLQNKILNMINTKVDYLLINLLNEVNQYIKKIFGGTVNIITSIFNKFEETEKNYKNEINQKDSKLEELSKQIKILNEKIKSISDNYNKKEKIKLKNNNNDNINVENKENEYLENRTDYNNDRSNREKSPNKEYNIITNNNDNSNFSISYNDEAKNIIDNLKQGNSNRNSKEDFKKINNIQNLTFNNNKTTNKIEAPKNNDNNNNNKGIYQNIEKKTISEISYIKSNNQNFLNEPSISYQPSLSNLSQYSNITNTNPRDLKVVIGPISKRDYSLRQLLETINDIYNSKLDYDKKLAQNHQQKLTMEQFLYHYLNNKYGLKNLVIEYASGIIQGIKDFSKKNSEVLLFGKILRNELEEQEILIISKLKETIHDFLIYYYQNKYQYKSKNEVDILVQKCKSGILVEDQWKNIVGYLFSENENDLVNLIQRIQKYIDRQNSTIESNKKYGNSISYQKFIQLVIDYQIKLRSLYLKNFNHIFKMLDTDHNGIIFDYEFVKLVEMANVYSTREEIEIKTQMMLKQLDKYGNKNILYNDIIELWSKEMTVDQITGEKLSLLDKLSME